MDQQEAKDEATQGTGALLPASSYVAHYVGGAIFDSLTMMLVMSAQAFQWAFVQLSRILVALLYVLGPLALVWAIPGPSDAGRRWFTSYVTIATWPILSSCLLALSASLMFAANDNAASTAATSFEALACCLLMVCLNLAVPLLASTFVGGTVRNVVLPSVVGMAAGAGGVMQLARSALASSRTKDEGEAGIGVDATAVDPSQTRAAAIQGSAPPSAAVPPCAGHSPAKPAPEQP